MQTECRTDRPPRKGDVIAYCHTTFVESFGHDHRCDRCRIRRQFDANRLNRIALCNGPVPGVVLRATCRFRAIGFRESVGWVEVLRGPPELPGISWERGSDATGESRFEWKSICRERRRAAFELVNLRQNSGRVAQRPLRPTLTRVPLSVRRKRRHLQIVRHVIATRRRAAIRLASRGRLGRLKTRKFTGCRKDTRHPRRCANGRYNDCYVRGSGVPARPLATS
jgi:hypothetical protein